MYSDLIASTRTVGDADRLLSEIDMLETLSFKPEIMSSISETNAQKIMKIFLRNNLDINNKDLYMDFSENLKAAIAKLKVIRLVLAFDPSSRTIEKIHNFIIDNVGIGYILDIEVEQSVLAGAIVIFNGKYNNFSLRKKLEDVFTNRRKEILSAFVG